MNFLSRLRVALGVLLGEKRFHVSQTPPGWVEKLGGTATVSGVTVTPDKSLEVTAVFSCVRILAETVASLPLPVYRRLPNGGKIRAPEHYLYRLLHDQPNPEMTSFTLRETLMGHVATWGNAYAEIDFNQGGGIDTLWPLRPDRMRVKRVNGRLQYIYRVPDKVGGQEITLDMERVFHLRGLGGNGIVGYSPIQLHRQAVGLALAAEEFGARFFGNDARPGVVLRHPGHLSDEAHTRLTKSWETRHGGLDKSHRVAILEEGLDLLEIGLPPGDAQFLETRKYQRNEIASIYRVPPHMIGDLERATFSNIEQQSLEFVIYTIWPWLVRWEQEIKRSLFTPIESVTYFAEFLIEGLLRGDIQSRYEAYATAKNSGWMNADEIRERENMNPLPNGQGKIYMVPLNMIPAGQAGLEPMMRGRGDTPHLLGTVGAAGDVAVIPKIEDRGQRSARARHRLMLAYQKIYLDVAARIVRREINDVRKAARKWFQRRDEAQFSLWLEEFYREHIGFVMEQMRPVAHSYGEVVAAEVQDEVGEEVGMTPRVEGFIESYVEAYAARHATISESRIREVVRQAQAEGRDPIEALDEAFGEWEEKRPAEISRWESVRFNNALAVGIYLIARRTTIRWRAFDKSCPYCAHLDGQVVAIKSWFIPAGTDFQPEGAEQPLHISHNLGHPPAHGGCDCMVTSG